MGPRDDDDYHRDSHEGDYLCCCPKAHVEMSETAALICLILNIFFPSLGTFVASFLDRRGCNCSAFGLSIL